MTRTQSIILKILKQSQLTKINFAKYLDIDRRNIYRLLNGDHKLTEPVASRLINFFRPSYEDVDILLTDNNLPRYLTKSRIKSIDLPDINMFEVTDGESLNLWCKYWRLTFPQAAKALGYSRMAIYQWVSGKRKLPAKISRLCRLAEYELQQHEEI